MSLHHHPAQCERKVGSLHWSLLTIVSRVLESGPGEGRGQAGLAPPWGGRPVDPQLAKGPLCRLCVGLPLRVVSPVRVGQPVQLGRPGRAAGRRGRGGRPGDPFAVPSLAPSVRCEVRAVVPAPSARRGSGAVLPPAVAVSRRLRERGSKGHRGLAVSSCGGTGARGGGGGRGGAAGESPCRLPRSSAWAGRAGAGCRGPGAGGRVPDAGCRMRMPRAA